MKKNVAQADVSVHIAIDMLEQALLQLGPNTVRFMVAKVAIIYLHSSYPKRRPEYPPPCDLMKRLKELEKLE